MISEFTRPMSEAERSLLERMATPTVHTTWGRTLKRVGVWFLVMLLCFGLVALAIKVPEPVGTILMIVPNVGVMICLGVMVLIVMDHLGNARHERRWRATALPQLQQAISDRRVSVRRVQPLAVIEIWQFEDEGDGYIFDVGDEKLLYIKGQWTERADGSPWPNTDFEIVRTERDRILLNLVCHGDKLEPVRSIDSTELLEYDWIDRDEVIEGELHTFANSLLDSEKSPTQHPLD
jgi:hypothetical protein